MRVLVSGGSRGIGEAVCLRIAEAALARGERPKIAVCGREGSEPQEQVARSVREMGGDAIALAGDLSDVDVAAKLVDAALAAFGGLDALVCNAGVASPAKICDLSVAEWDKMFDINLRGAWLLAKSSSPHLKESRGAACFTSSMSGQVPHEGSGAYSPTKAALTMLAQTLALEWAPDGNTRQCRFSGHDAYPDVREDVRGSSDQEGKRSPDPSFQDRRSERYRQCN